LIYIIISSEERKERRKVKKMEFDNGNTPRVYEPKIRRKAQDPRKDDDLVEAYFQSADGSMQNTRSDKVPTQTPRDEQEEESEEEEDEGEEEEELNNEYDNAPEGPSDDENSILQTFEDGLDIGLKTYSKNEKRILEQLASVDYKEIANSLWAQGEEGERRNPRERSANPQMNVFQHIFLLILIHLGYNIIRVEAG
jgi:hypothetical protein